MSEICHVDSDLPVLLTTVLTSLSVFIGVVVVLCGSKSAYEKAVAKSMSITVNNSSTTNISAGQFLKFLPKEIYRKKSCYFPIATHIGDQATDIAIIAEFYFIYQQESLGNNNENCNGINGLSLFILSVLAFSFYRIISSIWVYASTTGSTSNKLFHAMLQLLDLKNISCIIHKFYNR